MAKCIIHIGMPRTGTKSVQQSLKNLDDEGYYYARLRNQPNHSVSIPVIFANRGEQGRPARPGKGESGDLTALSDQCRSDLRSSIKIANGRTLVISGEGILRMAPADLKRLKGLLTRLGCEDIDIIAYVRAPLSYIQGAIQQRIKLGNASILKINEALPGYRESFSKFDDIFGASKVQLLKFDPAAFAEGDVVRDFCSKTGIAITSVTPVRRNDAITRLAAQLRFQYIVEAKAKGHEPMSPALALALCDKLRALDPAGFRIAPSMLRPYLDQIGEDIAWMEKRLGASLAEDEQDKPADVSSEASLLEPVPGIDERLRELLRSDGDPADNSGLDTSALLLRIADRNAPPRTSRPGLVRNGVTGSPNETSTTAGGPNEERAVHSRDTGTQHFEPKHLTIIDAKAKPIGAIKSLMRIPFLSTPPALLNKDKNLIVLWSPKSACTSVYVWFSHISGFSEDVRNYATWPHRHRMEQYMRSTLYAESAGDGMAGAKALRVIREPYGRAVSIYRHALQTDFADENMKTFSDGRIDREAGYSFQSFLDLLEQIDMKVVDIHFRPQFHPYEATRKADRVINISKSDLFTELNQFEEDSGMQRTNFADLAWLQMLEHKRKASQVPMPGDALDQMPFSRKMANAGKFPSYAQLLTPRARQRIESIYKIDFDAYHQFL